MGWAILDSSVEPMRVDSDFVRDEDEQVCYLGELLPLFEETGMDEAFWFTFAHFGAVHDPDPRFDLDLASYGLVKMVGGEWRPKAAFAALAAAYGQGDLGRVSCGCPTPDLERRARPPTEYAVSGRGVLGQVRTRRAPGSGSTG